VVLKCPRCESDAAVTSIAAPDGGLLYTCWFTHNGDGHVSWQVSNKSTVGISSEGVTLELVDPFERILHALLHALIEYGVLEYRLRIDYPELFAAHVAARGHVLTGMCGGHATASSVRFAVALLRLERAKVVSYHMRPATGAWRYNEQISFWVLNPAPSGGAVLTWADYCERLGRGADWTDDDRVAVTSMAAAATPAH
jgi:hypothetical protein